MVPVIAIVGRSKSGKTTLIERLIPELKSRGYRVATIKHHMANFEIDYQGKDSYRHKNAGAYLTIISSPHKVALIEDTSHDLTLDELVSRYIREVDIVIAEGFKSGQHPKIEVYKSKHPIPLAARLQNVIAVVSEVPLASLFTLRPDDIKGIADTIEKLIITPQKERTKADTSSLRKDF